MQLKPNHIVINVDDDGTLTVVDYSEHRTEPTDLYALNVVATVIQYGCGRIPAETINRIEQLKTKRPTKTHEDIPMAGPGQDPSDPRTAQTSDEKTDAGL
jgi:hypothetical protein